MTHTARFRGLLLVFLLLMFALPAAATRNQSETNPPSIDDWWIIEGDWWYTQMKSGYSYTTCAFANGCWTCLQNQYGKRVCAFGVAEGNCNCQDVQREGSGAGITDCRLAYGYCKVRTAQ